MVPTAYLMLLGRYRLSQSCLADYNAGVGKVSWVDRLRRDILMELTGQSSVSFNERHIFALKATLRTRFNLVPRSK